MSILAKPPLNRRDRPSLALLVAITACGTLAMHIFVPALPWAAADLGVSAGAVQLTISLYLVGVAFGQLVYGPLSDRFGRRPVLLASLLLYTVSAIAAALAPSLGALVTARVFQALGGCGGLVLGRAMARDGVGADQAVARLSMLNLVMSAAPATAPLIGAYTTVHFGWRAIFVGLTLASAALLVIAALALPETHKARIALPGLRPMMASYMRLLRSPVFRGYALGGACTTTSLYAFIAASPFIFDQILHRPTQDVGRWLLLLMAGVAVGSFIAGRLAGRFDRRLVTTVANFIVIAAGAMLLWANLTGTLNIVTIMAPMTLFAFGAGLASPFAITGAVSADPTIIGAASGLYGFIQMGFGALCTVIGSLHASSMLPVVLVLLGSGLLGQICFRLAAKPVCGG